MICALCSPKKAVIYWRPAATHPLLDRAFAHCPRRKLEDRRKLGFFLSLIILAAVDFVPYLLNWEIPHLPIRISMEETEDKSKVMNWWVSMPKVELHAHLNGSIRNSTLLELARELGEKGTIVFSDFQHVVEDFAAENVVYLELRTTPKIKRDMNQTKETSIWRRQGRREFRVTYLCTDRETKQAFACKSISKKKLPTTVDVEDVRREVAIMSTLPEHPNIVKLCATYEDHEAVHLVMELCEGGGLFDRIVARGHYSE
ncbi:hypothetical protein L2E82_48453 [Cichorium intybus]|uniref:Uncharacterized protein n=1 Tax=Cichorium intybus TaxID=13427 RepID=A0ACB8YYP0_CICIN|nr:hypothetical protein L2E82_48453 [Cichorium intybus]